MAVRIAKSHLWPELRQFKASNEVKEIFIEGDIKSGDWIKSAAAVVGSRAITEYGRQVTQKLVGELVAADKIIVSGMMYGVDQEAHRQCLAYGGRTIAVLGWGINWPGENKQDKQLRNRILESGGGIISEWDDQEPGKWTFPRRNRLVAALARDIYVVEAAEKSGSLITAEWGKKLGRTVWAVPGPINSRVSRGTNSWLAKSWAKPWVGNMESEKCSNNKTEVYIAIHNEPMEINELCRKLRRLPEEISGELIKLQLAGLIFTGRDGKYYAGKN